MWLKRVPVSSLSSAPPFFQMEHCATWNMTSALDSVAADAFIHLVADCLPKVGDSPGKRSAGFVRMCAICFRVDPAVYGLTTEADAAARAGVSPEAFRAHLEHVDATMTRLSRHDSALSSGVKTAGPFLSNRLGEVPREAKPSELVVTRFIG